MTETHEQYVDRLLGYLGEQDALGVLQATPSRLEGFVDGVTEARLRERPHPAKWSMAQIVLHLAEAEIVVGYRIRAILGNNGAPISAYDQDEWSRRYDRAPLSTALAMHRTLRELNLALYRSLTPEEWSRYGVHSERGRETVLHTVRLTAGHDLNHLTQLEVLKG